MKTAFAVGAGGFIGEALVRGLRQQGWRVKGLAHRPIPDDTDIIVADVRSGSWHQAVSGCEVLIYAAGIHGSVRLPFKDRLDIELKGVYRAVAAVRKAGVRKFIYIGTAYTNGETNYARAKLAAQRWLQDQIDQGFDAVLVCPVIVYGPGDRKNLSRLFAQTARGFWPLVGSGDNLWQLVYIDDLIEGILKVIAQWQKIEGRKLIIGPERGVRFKELVREVSASLGKEVKFIRIPQLPLVLLAQVQDRLSSQGLPIFFNSDTISTLIADHDYDCRESAKVLGWKPKIKLADGLAKTGKWYRQEGII